MSTYTPDKWIVVKISHEDKSHYRVFANWYGGFAKGDSWKLNSGITKATLEDDFYHFEGSSGSVYVCHKNNYGMSTYGHSVLNHMTENYGKDGVVIEQLPEETHFLELHYE